MKRIIQKKFEKKLNYLLKQKLRYNGELITLTIHVTILTYLILILLYILMKVLQMRYHWWYILIQDISVLGLKAIKIGIYTYCKNKDFLHIKVMEWQCHSCQLFQQHGEYKISNSIILSWEYGILVPKTNSGLQQHI